MSRDLFELTPAGLDTVRAEVRRERHKAALVGRMISLYGRGPDGATCGQCEHLFARGGVAGRYLKCAYGPKSRGPATDWRSRWSACGKFNPEPA